MKMLDGQAFCQSIYITIKEVTYFVEIGLTDEVRYSIG